jgi:hypothetical protein
MLSNFITDRYSGGFENNYEYSGGLESNSILYGIIIGSLLFMIILRLHYFNSNKSKFDARRYQEEGISNTNMHLKEVEKVIDKKYMTF